jgi:hypothetical protein
MKKLNLFAFLIIWLSGQLICQTLKPSIGLISQPQNGDAICSIPTYTGNFQVSGYQNGDTIPHFKLYDKNGVATDVLTVLQIGKPLLLIGGSYTCPVFRQKINKINQVASVYGSQLNIYIIYSAEAHPKSPDVSPYSGTVWTTSENQTAGILYLQPQNYVDRVQILNDMLANSSYTLSVPVLLDGPCNEWLLNFGPAPNNAYLIKPNGVIFKKHAWFDKNPDNIVNDIETLLTNTLIHENHFETLRIYPNPVANMLNFDATIEIDAVTIHEITGKKLLTEKPIAGSIDISVLESGCYLYTVRGKGYITHGKFFKQ